MTSVSRSWWAIALTFLLVVGLVPLLPAPAEAATPTLRAIPWNGCEPPCSYLAGINGYEDEVDKFRFKIEAADADGDVTVEWSGDISPDAVLGGAGTPGVNGFTTFEWNPGEADGANTPNGCYFPDTGNYATGMCHWITITATQGGESVSVDVYLRVLEVDAPPIITGVPVDPVVEVGQLLTFDVDATDPDIPADTIDSFRLFGAEDDPPTGAAIDSATGVFTWTPTADQVGLHPMEVAVFEAEGGGGFVEFTVTVVAGGGDSPPVIDPIDDFSADEGTLIEVTPVVSDPDGDAFTLGWTGVPAGATTVGGTFSWTPTEAQGPGPYEITVTAQNALSDSETFTITVDEVNEPPVLDPIGGQSATVGEELTFTATASDPDLPEQDLTFGLTGAPAGATIDPVTGDFSWTPATDADPTPFSVTVTDGEATDHEAITVVVAPTGPTADVYLGAFEMVAADPDGDGDILTGTAATYELTYGANSLFDDAPDAVITIDFGVVDDFPGQNGAIFGVTDAGGCTPVGVPVTQLVCDVGPLAAGTSGTLSFTILHTLVRLEINDPEAEVEFDARIETSIPDPFSAGSFDNNAARLVKALRTRQADLSVVAHRPPPLLGPLDPVFFGEATGFEFRADNAGPDTADATVTVSWFDGAWDLHTAPPGCSADVASFTCDIAALGDGSNTGWVYFALTEVAGAASNHDLTVTVGSADSEDLFPTNDTFDLPVVPVVRTSDIEVDLALVPGGPGDDGTAQPGDQLTYRADIRNLGPHDSLQTDAVFRFVGHLGDVTVVDDGGCTPFAGNAPDNWQGLSCDLGFMAESGFTTIVFTAEVPATELALWVVSAQVSTGSDDPVDANDRTSLGLTVEEADGTDTDGDGLTDDEEALTGTDPKSVDSDHDGLPDGADSSWLTRYVKRLPADAFASRWNRGHLVAQLAMVQAAVRVDRIDLAIALIDRITTRADGCGTDPDRDDWVIDCEAQGTLRALLGLLRRNLAEQ